MTKLKRKNFRFGEEYRNADLHINGQSRFISCFFNLKYSTKADKTPKKSLEEQRLQKAYRATCNKTIRRKTAIDLHKIIQNTLNYENIIFSDQKTIRAQIEFAI